MRIAKAEPVRTGAFAARRKLAVLARFTDTFSHDGRDDVLTAVARIIHKHIRLSDLTCRCVGEGLVLLPAESDLQSAAARAEKLRLAIREPNLTHREQTLPAPTDIT